MESVLANELRLKYQPVAILVADEAPTGALQYQPGKWGCVMAAFGAVAERGRVAAFTKETVGCWGGGVGLGFGNAYLGFPGGPDCFCSFLSDGNDRTDKGKAVAEQCASWMRGDFLHHFLRGERYRKNPALVDQWINSLPIIDLSPRCVVFKPLPQVEAGETPASIVFLANTDQMSALVVLASYGRGDTGGAIIPHCAGCQSIGILTYREDESPAPRAVVGLNDISARRYLRRLGKDLVTVSVPFKLYQEMESNVPGSFLEEDQWRSLLDD